MHDRQLPAPDAQRLPESVASRLFARASELDAALAELRGAEEPVVAEVRERPRRRARRWALGATVAAFVTVATLALSRLLMPADGSAAPGVPMVEESVLLQCLAPGEAVEVIRPLLDPTNTVVISPESAPRVLTIRGTPTQIRDVKALLERYEGDGSPACARP